MEEIDIIKDEITNDFSNWTQTVSIEDVKKIISMEKIRELPEILKDIRGAIEMYQTLKLKDVHTQGNILRKLTTNLAQLENYRAEYYDMWLDCYFKSKEQSNAAKEKQCDRDVPELHMIRKVMRGGYKVCDSIRSTIGIFKNE